MAPRAKPTIGKQSRLPFAPSSAEKPTSSAPSNPSSASNSAAKPAENDVNSSAQASANLREEGRCRVTPASDGSHHHGAGETLSVLRMQRANRRSGGEALHQGRIGDSLGNVGWPRASTLSTGVVDRL